MERRHVLTEDDFEGGKEYEQDEEKFCNHKLEMRKLEREMSCAMFDRPLSNNNFRLEVRPQSYAATLSQYSQTRFAKPVKKGSLHNTDERPAKVIIQELQVDKVDIVPREYSSIRKAIYIARRSVKPKLPRDIDETIHVLEEGNFDKPDDFTYATKNKVVMMTFEKNYQYFTNDSPLFGDGTFKCSPQFFFPALHFSR
ncbi:hypothetical protein RRG08_006546 [Elysia crispata]|uniref:Uncharacterized protein n=1 Tax=Elysia crispata TaxID=231223 RepID=A0AAE1E450_9GAST|nr:hypothetical protein RRG08_006546 [Elysia crispata]